MNGFECAHCGCDRLASTTEQLLHPGDPLVCGACGSLSILDAHEVDGGWVAKSRRPRPDEARFWRLDPDVARILDAYHVSVLEGTGSKPKSAARKFKAKFTWKGPDAR